jgi:hypothetical protein
MKLLTNEMRKKLPLPYTLKDKNFDNQLALYKFFGGSRCSIYVFEGEAVLTESDNPRLVTSLWPVNPKEVDVEFFVYVVGLGLGCPELTYMRLSQLEELKFPLVSSGAPVMPLERDLYYVPESFATIQKREEGN